MNDSHTNPWKTFGMVILVILAVIGAGTVFFFVTCLVMLSQMK
jgi:hypothetical protein